ncbi:basic proline-rich protein-like [Moschus berezovskii]|uniref:basic proline-rich protein-like n=1 Tax=Moschus berezovskii TaxID=68408 RepID=UPI002444BB66|nr:basic proline-rich protein-like [Moschus berezovskii]
MVARGPAPPPSRRGAAARPAAARLGAQPRRDCGELIPAGSAPRAQRRARAARPQPLRGPRAAPQRRACRPLGAGTWSSPPRAHPDPARPPRTQTHTAAVTVPAFRPACTPLWPSGRPHPRGAAGSLGSLRGSPLGGAVAARGAEGSRASLWAEGTPGVCPASGVRGGAAHPRGSPASAQTGQRPHAGPGSSTQAPQAPVQLRGRVLPAVFPKPQGPPPAPLHNSVPPTREHRGGQAHVHTGTTTPWSGRPLTQTPQPPHGSPPGTQQPFPESSPISEPPPPGSLIPHVVRVGPRPPRSARQVPTDIDLSCREGSLS